MTTASGPAVAACSHLFLPGDGDCLRCFTPKPSDHDAPLHPHPITVPCGRCAEQVPFIPARYALANDRSDAAGGVS